MAVSEQSLGSISMRCIRSGNYSGNDVEIQVRESDQVSPEDVGIKTLVQISKFNVYLIIIY